ncbi:hypothetical protein CDD83_1949 [Cordyceps sp. RAO-2017]|nr:hypothetical protein CDD83_1949 [Cordyceps sp. RAO-2017]
MVRTSVAVLALIAAGIASAVPAQTWSDGHVSAEALDHMRARAEPNTYPEKRQDTARIESIDRMVTNFRHSLSAKQKRQEKVICEATEAENGTEDVITELIQEAGDMPSGDQKRKVKRIVDAIQELSEASKSG